MNAALNFNNGCYTIDYYMTLNGEVYPSWHTLRQFKNQGDAILFQEYVNLHAITPEPYAKTFNQQKVCTYFTMRNGRPYLQMSNL